MKLCREEGRTLKFRYSCVSVALEAFDARGSDLLVILFSSGPQEPGGVGERAGCGAGRPGGLPGLSAAGSRILHRHLGVSVLSGHRKLPVFLTEGEPVTRDHSIARQNPV